MQTTNNPQRLAEVLRSTTFLGRSVIGIDGAPGSGKSTLAAALAPLLGATVVSVDLFLNQHEGQYFKSLRLNELRSELVGTDGPLIVEGICLLHVLEAVSVPYDQLVYVKLMDGGGWQDAQECDITGDPQTRIDELLESLREFERALGDEPSEALPPAREEVIRYHAKYRPQDRATVEYLTTL